MVSLLAVHFHSGLMADSRRQKGSGLVYNVAIVVISGHEERRTLFRALSVSHNAFLKGSLEPVLPNGAIFPIII